MCVCNEVYADLFFLHVFIGRGPEKVIQGLRDDLPRPDGVLHQLPRPGGGEAPAGRGAGAHRYLQGRGPGIHQGLRRRDCSYEYQKVIVMLLLLILSLHTWLPSCF